MKFTVERDRMAEAMSAVMRQAKNSLVIPILHNVLLDAKESKLQISACNLDSYSQAVCPAEVGEAGACTIPAASLNGLLDELPEGSQVTITYNNEGRAHLKSGRSQYRLPTLPATDFPNAFELTGGVKVTLTQVELKRLFTLQQCAVSTDKQRLPLVGVCLQMEDGRLVGVATNAYTLFRTTLPHDLNGAASIIVPREAIGSILLFDDEQVELEWSERILAVRSGSVTFATKLIDAKFPPYQNLIPAAAGPCITIEREELRGMIARLKAAADEATEISLSWGDNPVEISGKVAHLAEGDDCIACQGEGMTASKIILSPTLMSNLLSILTADTLRLFIPGPTSPVRLVDPKDDDLTILQMPIFPRGGA